MMMVWYLLLNMKLTTLWRGTHHMITPGYPLLQRDIIAEGNQDFLLTNQKMKAQIGERTIALPMKLPMKMMSCDKFAVLYSPPLVSMDSSWTPHSPHGVLMESSWSPHGVPMESSWSPHGVPMESSWSPRGVLMDFVWTMVNFCEICLIEYNS